MSELKPCPFCGEEPRLLSLSHGFHIECQTAGCDVLIATINVPDKADAIAVWNTRAESASVGRINGEIGLIANRQFGISDNLQTEVTLQFIESEIVKLKRRVLSSDQYSSDMVDFLTRFQAGEYSIIRVAEIIQDDRERNAAQSAELQRLRTENESILHDVMDGYGRTNPDLRTAAVNVMKDLNEYHLQASRLERELQRLREVEKAAIKLVTEIEQMPTSLAIGILCNEITALRAALQREGEK